MHQDVLDYVDRWLAQLPPPTSVLEPGGRRVNGNCVDQLASRFAVMERYVTVDINEGPGVDHVGDFAAFDTDERFDLVLCTETLEHAHTAEGICRNAYRLLKPGGHFIVTTAWTGGDNGTGSQGRLPHSGIDGHLLGEHWTSDPADGSGREFYQNISEEMLREWMADFEIVDLDCYGCDIRAVGRKPE